MELGLTYASEASLGISCAWNCTHTRRPVALGIRPCLVLTYLPLVHRRLSVLAIPQIQCHRHSGHPSATTCL